MKDTTEEILTLLTDHGARLHALLVRVTLREDVAEDLMQELFLTLAERHGFDRAKDPVAYAIRSATNLAFDWRRAQKRAPASESSYDHLCADDGSPLTKLVEREDQQRVLDVMGGLPKSSRDIVVMRYLQQQSYEEIGKILGKTPHQARGLCHKALDRLRRLIDRQSSIQQASGGS